MFEQLQERLSTALEGLSRRAVLSEADVTAALRDVRVALLEADVALPVVKDFIAQVGQDAVERKVLKSVTPAQMVIKVVHDKLVEMLGAEATPLNLAVTPPAVMMMVGLQGAGKTTSTAKIAKRLTDKDRKKVLMASLDVRRPAAQQQLQVLGAQTGVRVLPIVPGEKPVAIARRAVQMASLEGFDVVILDTAGRLAIDEDLMAEAVAVRDATTPAETLLVADAMTGQDAVAVAQAFHEKIGLSGLVMTRMDGDARGGAALSMRAVTGCPIKLMGMGEKLEELEDFHPDRVASRILGMGDIVSLVEKATENFEEEEAEKLARKMQKGVFDLNDLATQLRQMQKMGGLGSVMDLLPGMNSAMMKKMKDAKPDDRMVGRQLAIISSMTPGEREKPDIIKARRKQRIAKGCGLAVQDVNRLLKQHQDAARMMKKVQKMGKKGLARGGLQGFLPRGFGGLPK